MVLPLPTFDRKSLGSKSSFGLGVIVSFGMRRGSSSPGASSYTRVRFVILNSAKSRYMASLLPPTLGGYPEPSQTIQGFVRGIPDKNAQALELCGRRPESNSHY